ncbi:hypothetical protein H6G91_33285 [Nostoc muscorum FACHB-395]|nr:hypothetical protein [Desmonostoc muscorum FACHB-395]
MIDLWVRKQQQASADITLCCFEKMGDFCHRHIVEQEVVERSSLTLPEASLPQMWGGEVGLVTDQMSTNRTQNDSKLAQLSNGIGQPNTLITTGIFIEKSYTRTATG